ETEKTHPARRVVLFEDGSIRKFLAAINDRDVVEPEKSAFKDVVAFAVDPVHPPRKIHEQLVKTSLEKLRIALAGALLFELEDAPASPRMNRRGHVGEFPLVRRDLAVRMLELFEQEDPEILFCELGVDERGWGGMQSKIPFRETTKL